jgi:hypothetical protein
MVTSLMHFTITCKAISSDSLRGFLLGSEAASLHLPTSERRDLITRFQALMCFSRKRYILRLAHACSIVLDASWSSLVIDFRRTSSTGWRRPKARLQHVPQTPIMSIVHWYPATPHAGLEDAIRSGSANSVLAVLRMATEGGPTKDQIQAGLDSAVDLEHRDIVAVLLQHGAVFDLNHFCHLTQQAKEPVLLLQTLRDYNQRNWGNSMSEIMASFPALCVYSSYAPKGFNTQEIIR